MKQNWTQLLSLILCAAVLMVVLVQNRQLKEQQRQLESEIRQLRSTMQEEIRQISSNIERELEKANRSIADYSLEPKEVSQEQQALLAEVSVSLKEWYADTEVTLLVKVAEEEHSLPAEHAGNGRYFASLALPLGESYEISLSALISGGGLTKQEDCGAWGDLSQLLPLRNSGSGWDGPNYENGVLSSNFSVFIEGRDGMPGHIKNPHFLVYQNGSLVQTIPAVIDPYSGGPDSVSYTVDLEGHRWRLPCEIGDAIDIRFRCEDEFGLGYDFLFGNWTAAEDASPYQSGATFQSGASPLILYWP